ncbi:MAG: heme peroxidase, partial [Rhizobiaceae bacterium]|nr:heme peroxidase [Rhizobiaceae bacterium]
MVTLVRHDLEFILKQIKIAEAHSDAIEQLHGQGVVGEIGDELRELVESPLLPDGLRTVDGSFNNLVPGREKWGASGEPFPRLTSPNWVNESDDQITFGQGSQGEVTFTDGNYGEHGAPFGPGGLGGGTLVDADPRIISNLIVDQTLANPAVIAAALRHAGLDEADIPAAVTEIRAAYLNQPDFSEALANAQADVATAQAAVGAAQQAVVDVEDIADLQPLLDALAAAEAALTQEQAELVQIQTDAAAFDALLDDYGIQMDGNTVLLPNVSPDEGLSAPYNSWFTLFGQFFDHGLDLVKKGGNGTVYIPLQTDDPLYNSASPHTNFMALTRASVGEDAGNVTTPWVDQNQTYTSHASHQVFLREYVMVGGKPVATGLLLEGTEANTLATWGDVKAQARTMLGIELTDADVGMVPLLRTDPYGNFIPHPETGFAQVIIGIGADGIPNTADDLVVSATVNGLGVVTPVNPTEVGAIRIPNAFLDDIAHAAAPVLAGGVLQRDGDDALGYSGGFIRGQQTSYDNELLDAHFITGDGRGNENIGLTAVHYVFHAEHNRLVEQMKATILATNDEAFIAEWHDANGNWDGERLFQAARFTTEMQYQHLVFEEFARKIQPDVDIFLVEPDVEINPAIFAEFANVVYRFGHSMLNQTVDRTYEDGTKDNIDLFHAFLNPVEFGGSGISQAQMAGAIAVGMSAQRGNEIDEFVTDVLRNQLVGIPLDLAAINIARGRDTGMPTLNQARAQFTEMANGDQLLRPYTSWADFALNLKNPESIINFIAAYGTHVSITTALTLEDKRDAAMLLVFGGAGAPADRLDFLNAVGIHAEKLGGLDNVDLWIGGLAEKKMAFGGMLGSTFSFIFQLQMENLQDSDRFYYLSRTQGLNLLTELENNSLAKMVMRNTDIADTGLTLPADIFTVPDHTLYMNYNTQMAVTELEDPQHSNPLLQAISALVERRDADGDGTAEYIRYNGLDHIVIQGTGNDDHIVSGGGDDTVWGGAGDDRIEAGYGVDSINGGEGDDIITSAGTDIGAISVLKGESGNDVIVDGTGMSLIFGGAGKDYLVSGFDDGEIRGGRDDDFLFGGDGMGMLFGNEGNDWIEGGGGFDYIAGDNGELFFNSTIIGHDVIDGGSGDTDYDADSGDDIMVAGEGIQKFIGMWGHDWVIYKGQATAADADMNFPVFDSLPLEVLRDRFSQVEAISGWNRDDVIRGDDRSSDDIEEAVIDPTPEGNFLYNELNQAAIDRIAGLDEIIKAGLMTLGEYRADGSWENGQSGTSELIFNGGNILLGGGGSDTIEGRGGNDVIDGDAWLNVRISVQAADGSGAEIATVNSMLDNMTLNGVTKSLTSWMLDGTINPGQLQIVREILWDDSGTDTAVFWDIRANYQILYNDDGSITVDHTTQTVGEIDPITGRNRQPDGRDTLYNIERISFADIDVVIGNRPATGLPIITGENNLLSVDLTGIQDENGRPPADSAYTVVWQHSMNGLDGWANVDDGGSPLVYDTGINDGFFRVVVSFTDLGGFTETITSQMTARVGQNGIADELDGTDAPNLLIGRGGNDILNGGLGDDTLIGGAGGADVLNGGEGDDVLDGGAGANDVAEYAGPVTDFNFARDGAGRIVVTDLNALNGSEGSDTLIGIERLAFQGQAGTIVAGSNASDTYIGPGVTQIVLGFGGDDNLDGGGGADILAGGAGNDIVAGGGGADTILWRSGDGRDFVDGGAGVDEFHVAGDASQEAYDIYTRAAAVAAGIAILNANAEIVITRNGTVIAELDNIEEIVVNGHGGGDLFNVHGDFTSTSLLMSTITLEGSDGDDVIDISGLTSAHRIVFRSNGGNDTIVGALRPQDVIDLGGDGADYVEVVNGDGSRTVSANGHSVTYFGSPSVGDDDDHDDDDHDDDDHDDDDHGSCGDDDGDGPSVPGPSSGSGPAYQVGTGAADVLVGGAVADTLIGHGGDDTMLGGAGDDALMGGEGRDYLFGDDGRDVLHGGAGDD